MVTCSRKMDANISCIAKSDEFFEAGKYHDSLEILLGITDAYLSAQQKIKVVRRVIQIKRRLMESHLAIPEAKKYVELEKQLSGIGSKNYAIALNELALCQVKNNNNKARQNVQKAISIMKKLKLEGTEEYGLMLYSLGDIFFAEEMLGDAIDAFQRARLLLARFGKGREYCRNALSLAICHTNREEHAIAEELCREAYELTLQRVGNKHLDYGTCAYQMAHIYLHQKDEKMGLNLLEESLSIYRDSLGDTHFRTLAIQKEIMTARNQGGSIENLATVATRKHLENSKDLAATVTREVMKELSIAYTDIQKIEIEKITTDVPIDKSPGFNFATPSALEILQKAVTPSDVFRIIEEYDIPSHSQTSCELLCALLRPPFDTQLTQEERTEVYSSLGGCYANQNDYKRALIYAQLHLSGVRDAEGYRTKHYALGLEIIAMYYMSLDKLDETRTFMTQAVDIMQEIGREDHKNYAGMIFILGNTEQRVDRFEKALEYYQKAKLLSNPDFDPEFYSTLLSCMDLCHRSLNQWDRAYEICMEDLRIAIDKYGDLSLRYSDVLCSLSCIYAKFKQYELAIVTLKKGINIRKQQKEATNVKTVDSKIAKSEADLEILHERSRIVHREDIDVGHMFRMCNECEKIKHDMDVCNGCCKAWYCNTECQLKHWPTHKKLCTVCFNCDKRLDRDAATFLRCSKCKAIKYCGKECQNEDWKEHKQTCFQIPQ